LKEWKTPGGTAAAVCLDMLKQPHLLIAGSTGSGKSVLINSLIYTALYHSPAAVRLILIDPKRVELVDYKPLPHCIRYASEPGDIGAALVYAVEVMEERYKRMQSARQKKSTEQDIFVIVDEFADFMITQKRETIPQIIRLAQLGRAANLHLILATQRPTRDIINGQIKVNLDSRVALRCPTGQDSRNIINTRRRDLNHDKKTNAQAAAISPAKPLDKQKLHGCNLPRKAGDRRRIPRKVRGLGHQSGIRNFRHHEKFYRRKDY
jgi:DNA segregation ATPase FtsK/SpoIIIE-like protein